MRTGVPHEWEISMNIQRELLLFVTLTAAAATPALAQTATPAPAGVAAHGAASIPDFSRVWNHPALPWFEPPASGPGPIPNRSRGPHRPGGATGSQRTAADEDRLTQHDNRQRE